MDERENIEKTPSYEIDGVVNTLRQGRIIQSWPGSLPHFGKNKSIIAYNNLFVKYIKYECLKDSIFSGVLRA